MSKNVRSRDQFKKYETETRSLRDQGRDRDRDSENWSRDFHHCCVVFAVLFFSVMDREYDLNK